MGFAGTDISPQDAEVILTSLVKAYAVVPSAIRDYIPGLDRILESIPDEARKYKLGDLIKLLEWADQNQIVI